MDVIGVPLSKPEALGHNVTAEQLCSTCQEPAELLSSEDGTKVYNCPSCQIQFEVDPLAPPITPVESHNPNGQNVDNEQDTPLDTPSEPIN